MQNRQNTSCKYKRNAVDLNNKSTNSSINVCSEHAIVILLSSLKKDTVKDDLFIYLSEWTCMETFNFYAQPFTIIFLDFIKLSTWPRKELIFLTRPRLLRACELLPANQTKRRGHINQSFTSAAHLRHDAISFATRPHWHFERQHSSKLH